MIFFCVLTMYSGEYDACDVTLSVCPHRAGLKNMPGHGGNRTYDLWNTSPMLCQLSYAVAQLAEVVGSIPTVARHIFQAYPVWTYTESNITSNHIRTCFQHIKIFPNANANHRRFFYLFYHIFLQTTHKRLIEVATVSFS